MPLVFCSLNHGRIVEPLFLDLMFFFLIGGEGFGQDMCKCSWRPEENISSLGTGVIGGCELSCVELGSSARAAHILSH